MKLPLRLIQMIARSRREGFREECLAEGTLSDDGAWLEISTENYHRIVIGSILPVTATDLDPVTTTLPSLPQQATSLVRSAGKFARSGFATTDAETLATREATCKACPEWDAQAINSTGRCKKCGCSTWAKLRMASEKCPLGKW